MPCYDERSSPSYIYDNELKPIQKKLAKVEAMLCGVLTVLEGFDAGNGKLSNVLQNIDYKEMGVTRTQVEQWWTNHKAEDARRKAEEFNRKRREKAHKRNQLIDAEELVKRLKKDLNE